MAKKIAIKAHTRPFSAAKLPPRDKSGKWRSKSNKPKKSKQTRLF